MMRAQLAAVVISVSVLTRVADAADAASEFTAAQKLFANGEWAAAAKALVLIAPRLADPHKRSFAYRQLGLAQLELAQLSAADESFTLALSADPLAELNPVQDSPAAVARFRAVRARLDGTLTVTTDRPARVAVDGIDRGASPLSMKLPIGAHQIRATSADARFAAEVNRTLVFPAKATDLRLTLKAAVAFVDVTGPPGFSISVDGVPLAQTPAHGLAVLPGKRIITIAAAGHDPKVVPLTLAAGERRAIDGSLQKTAGPPIGPPATTITARRTRPWAWLATGVAAVAAGIGIALFAPTDPLVDHDSSRRNTGIGFMVAGGVNGVAAAVLFILHRDQPR